MRYSGLDTSVKRRWGGRKHGALASIVDIPAGLLSMSRGDHRLPLRAPFCSMVSSLVGGLAPLGLLLAGCRSRPDSSVLRHLPPANAMASGLAA